MSVEGIRTKIWQRLIKWQACKPEPAKELIGRLVKAYPAYGEQYQSLACRFLSQEKLMRAQLSQHKNEKESANVLNAVTRIDILQIDVLSRVQRNHQEALNKIEEGDQKKYAFSRLVAVKGEIQALEQIKQGVFPADYDLAELYNNAVRHLNEARQDILTTLAPQEKIDAEPITKLSFGILSVPLDSLPELLKKQDDSSPYHKIIDELADDLANYSAKELKPEKYTMMHRLLLELDRGEMKDFYEFLGKYKTSKKTLLKALEIRAMLGPELDYIANEEGPVAVVKEKIPAVSAPVAPDTLPLILFIEGRMGKPEVMAKMDGLISSINQILFLVENFSVEHEGRIRDLNIKTMARGTPAYYQNVKQLKEWVIMFCNEVNSGASYKENSNLTRALTTFLDNLQSARSFLLKETTPSGEIRGEERAAEPPAAVQPLKPEEEARAEAPPLKEPPVEAEPEAEGTLLQMQPIAVGLTGIVSAPAHAKDARETDAGERILKIIERSPLKGELADQIFDSAYSLFMARMKGLEKLLGRILRRSVTGEERSILEIKGAASEILLLGFLQLKYDTSGDPLTEISKDLEQISYFPAEIHQQDSGKMYLKGASEEFADSIDADGYRGASKTLIEIKSSIYFNWLQTGEIKETEKGRILKFINQARKYARAIKEGIIKKVEYHIIAPKIGEKVLDELRKIFKGSEEQIEICRYDMTQTEKAEIIEFRLKRISPETIESRAEAKEPDARPKKWSSDDTQLWMWACRYMPDDARSIICKKDNPKSIQDKVRRVHGKALTNGLVADLQKIQAVRKIQDIDQMIATALLSTIKAIQPSFDTNTLSITAIKKITPIISDVKQLVEKYGIK